MNNKIRDLLTAFTAVLCVYPADSFAIAVHSLTITDWDMQTGGSITFECSNQQTNMQVVMGQYQGTPVHQPLLRVM
jgi:hypothetical protein